ncbi:MAG: DUF4065 domain-containing protein [Ruminococcus sp.]|nr:DUF4065 domain-containing protein [Ruminococcus sp.]
MANVFDVAKYILQKEGNMSTMKLQKLCYYCQAWSLVWDDKPLFDEEFHAWANGPVCRELFFKTQGKFFATPEDETGGEGDLTKSSKETIDTVLEHYAGHNAQWLSELTHMEDPWKNARKGALPGTSSDEIINKEDIAMYYGSL